ncbi:hypothetical protein ASPCAL04068 [Aspergillus calidoustus]|uniref:Leucine Rich Repeat domain protein n=1 Tax=Aspergillus calidoustus TaxID=454130 RepID=A0A0U5C504_ASPCI|nr:hypothetical protein ASPCAL04068 [Aspergillus calidoustus]
MDSDPPLPPPLRIRHRSPTSSTSTTTTNNNSGTSSSKPRAHRSSLAKTYRLSPRFDDQSSQPSSDPALFSSDDIPASGLENYHAPASGSGSGTGSRKRRYRGTWWGEVAAPDVREVVEAQGYGYGYGNAHGRKMKRKRAEFKDKRLVDSGVWMGSDESGSVFASEGDRWGEELLGGSVEEDVRQGEGDNVHVTGNGNGSGMVSAGTRMGFAKKVEEESKEHRVARAIVNDCLERGEDSIDLSNGNLRGLPLGLLRPLQHLTKLPPIKEAPITEEVYSSLQPFLRLFLAGNGLLCLTSELFELDALRVLSLRNNKLTEVPPAIRRLTKLQELNLSVNRLQFLPWELLWLIKKGDLKQLTVRPNPLLQIEESQISQWHLPTWTETETETQDVMRSCEYTGPPPEEAWAPIHVATGPITLYDMEGFPLPDTLSGPNPNSHSHSLSTAQTQPQPPSRVPSLREVALLTFSKSTSPSDTDLIPEDDTPGFPNLMLRLLRLARNVRNAGGRSCSICHRSFVIARAEWIEWWDCSTYENGLKGARASGERLRPLPFRRLGCSSGCVPAFE